MKSVSCRIEIAGGFHEIRAVNVGDKAESHGTIAVILQRLVGHNRPKVGAADPDIDDIPYAFAGVAFPAAITDAPGKIGHLVEHGMDLRHDILAIHRD